MNRIWLRIRYRAGRANSVPAQTDHRQSRSASRGNAGYSRSCRINAQRIPGRARVSRAGDGILAIANFFCHKSSKIDLSTIAEIQETIQKLPANEVSAWRPRGCIGEQRSCYGKSGQRTMKEIKINQSADRQNRSKKAKVC